MNWVVSLFIMFCTAALKSHVWYRSRRQLEQHGVEVDRRIFTRVM